MSDRAQADFHFRLFITGATPHSTLAVKNITAICDKYLPGRFKLEIIDVYQQPHLAEPEGIIAAPTLVKLQPLPQQRLIGDLSDLPKVLQVLDIVPPEGQD